MCELFGASFKEAVNIKSELKEFYSHGVKHPHGWGLMRFHLDTYEVIREPVRAIDSKILSETIEQTEAQCNVLAHIRLATVGAMRPENCHPYVGNDASGRTWTLIHNGTIYSSNRLMKYLDSQQGDTDSERVFLYLLELLDREYNQTGSLTATQRFHVVESLVLELSARNKLNLMIFDGEILYIHKNMKNTLSMAQIPQGFLFSTTPVNENAEWHEVPMCQLFAYKQGELLFESNHVTKEFVPSLEYISALAAMNI